MLLPCGFNAWPPWELPGVARGNSRTGEGSVIPGRQKAAQHDHDARARLGGAALAMVNAVGIGQA